jgi:hypothetical protein
MSSAANGKPLETNGRLNICRELINGKQAVKLDQAVDDYLIGDQLNFVNKVVNLPTHMQTRGRTTTVVQFDPWSGHGQDEYEN